jgi:hypothetical protein
MKAENIISLDFLTAFCQSMLYFTFQVAQHIAASPTYRTFLLQESFVNPGTKMLI